jgi:hypothetical protein
MWIAWAILAAMTPVVDAVRFIQRHLPLEPFLLRLLLQQLDFIHFSCFQAHVAPVKSVEEVKAVVSILLQNSKLRNATHNMMAYRIQQADKAGVYIQVGTLL